MPHKSYSSPPGVRRHLLRRSSPKKTPEIFRRSRLRRRSKSRPKGVSPRKSPSPLRRDCQKRAGRKIAEIMREYNEGKGKWVSRSQVIAAGLNMTRRKYPKCNNVL